MASTVRPVLAAVIAAAVFPTAATAKSVRVTVGPANVDRASQLITFPLTAGEPRADGVRDKNGAILPLQIAADGTAAFIVPVQKAGETLTFTISEDGSATAAKGVVVSAAKDALKVTLGGKPVFDYQMNKDALPRPDIKPAFKRAGYLHPIHTQSGTIVSDDYPVQHVHHHGIWSPWTKTTFQGRKPDFWNMGDKTGTVEFEEVTWTWSGAVHGGFVARHRFVDLSAPNPVTALHEVWQVTAYNVSDARVFDLVLTQVCATNDPLGLPRYHYGGLGFRGRGEWYGKDKANFLTSEGETDRVKANAQTMRWVHLSGAVEGGTAGLAVLGHPDNFRAPQPVRVHPSEPYVSFTPSQGGDWKIQPGKPYVARYRFVAADGPPDRARLDALWNGFAIGTTVKVENVP
ncbi:MAG: PmoA family protein [Opitutaceae bacterium]|nr:PmoA family protein [Opitutaceae bacterium]